MVGAIDLTHIEIMPPEGDKKVDYYSRKQKWTINTNIHYKYKPSFLRYFH